MKRALVALTGAVLLLAGMAGGWWLIRSTAEDVPPIRINGVDLAQGANLYADHCAACHGAELEGQPDWRSPGPDGRMPAPPHDETGHTWHHSDRVLFTYTKLGGTAALAAQGVVHDSGMPGFGEVLSDTEIRDVLGYIKSTWPDRVLAVQAERTAADP